MYVRISYNGVCVCVLLLTAPYITIYISLDRALGGHKCTVGFITFDDVARAIWFSHSNYSSEHSSDLLPLPVYYKISVNLGLYNY